jgi:hypothetical protein
MFGFPDCAAEVLLKYRDRLRDMVNVDACLDLLTPPLRGERLSYRQYNQKFEEDLGLFYPPA